MLGVQVEYWKLQETKRHNIETEDLGALNYLETKRHNVETENLGFSNLNESIRHNKVAEEQGFISLGIAQQQANAASLQASSAWQNARN